MKKFLFVPVLALAAVSLSCSKDNIAGEGGENASGSNEVIVFSEPQIEIGAVSAGTKTTLEGSSINWENIEYISLFNENGGSTWTYELSAGAGTTSATFTAQGEPQTGFTYAIYPQNSNVPSGAAIAANLATGQTYSEDGFPTLYPMGAKTEDGKTFVFENLATVLRLPLKGTGTIASITIESVGGEPLAGAATVDFSGDTPVMAAAEGASASVTLNCAESWPSLNESEPVYFNFVLFPGTYSQGFRFIINESNGNSTTVSTGGTAVDLVAGTFKNFDSPLTIDTPQGWNIYNNFSGGENWSWTALNNAHGLAYITDVTVADDSRLFKIRYGENEWYGIDQTGEQTEIPLNTSYTIYESSGNTNNGDLKVPAEADYTGNYDFYFDIWPHNIIITKAGEVPFYIMGTNNMDENDNWLGTRMELDETTGYIVLKNASFPSDKNGGPRFKILFGTNWDNNPYHIGAISDTNVQIDGKTTVGKENPGDIALPGSGPYDIYLDFNRIDDSESKMSVWIMNAGEVPAE